MTESVSKRLILVTGPSGAGRTTAIHALEDSGFETIDNMPLSLVPSLVDAPTEGQPIALGIDVRNRDFSIAQLIETIDQLGSRSNLQMEVLYLDCDPDVLLRRFSETRRRHPMAPDGTPVTGVQTELALLLPIKTRADVLINTSKLSPHDLRAEVENWFAPGRESRMAVSLQSFSYKRGLPRAVDMMFDCRFLKNPYWEPDLRSKTGRDADVKAYVANDPRYVDFLERVSDLVEHVLPGHSEEGRSHVSIAFGCTGGQHRSVALAEAMHTRLAAIGGWHVSLRHRELEQRTRQSADANKGN